MQVMQGFRIDISLEIKKCCIWRGIRNSVRMTINVDSIEREDRTAYVELLDELVSIITAYTEILNNCSYLNNMIRFRSAFISTATQNCETNKPSICLDIRKKTFN